MRISAIIKALEEFAPLSYQESWDNSGLQVGNPACECTGVLVCLDPTPEIVDEAASLGCNLIVAHHPLFFKPLKKLSGATPQEVTAMNAIAAGITIYSSHTASDSACGGVSYELARKLGVTPLRALDQLRDRLVHLRLMVPVAAAEQVRAALFDAGAGAIGSYDCCSFNVDGTGTFRALEGAKPFVGTLDQLHREPETCIDMVLPASRMHAVEAELLETHPYEEPAYQFTPMLNSLRRLGIGVYGTLEEGMKPDAFVQHVKDALGCKAVRTTKTDAADDTLIRRVAVCGGAGGSLIPLAKAAGAQAFVTADVKYHDFVDNRDGILLIDAGHYETEAPVKQVFHDVIKRKFPEVEVHVTARDDNPVNYC